MVADLSGCQNLFTILSTEDFAALQNQIRRIINAGVNDELDLSYKTIWTKSSIILGLRSEAEWWEAIAIVKKSQNQKKSSPYQLEILHTIKTPDSVSQGKGKKKESEPVGLHDVTSQSLHLSRKRTRPTSTILLSL
jgi:hypothetical protein